jgi:hypothetical protein
MPLDEDVLDEPDMACSKDWRQAHSSLDMCNLRAGDDFHAKSMIAQVFGIALAGTAIRFHIERDQGPWRVPRSQKTDCGRAERNDCEHTACEEQADTLRFVEAA